MNIHLVADRQGLLSPTIGNFLESSATALLILVLTNLGLDTIPLGAKSLDRIIGLIERFSAFFHRLANTVERALQFLGQEVTGLVAQFRVNLPASISQRLQFLLDATNSTFSDVVTRIESPRGARQVRNRRFQRTGPDILLHLQSRQDSLGIKDLLPTVRGA